MGRKLLLAILLAWVAGMLGGAMMGSVVWLNNQQTRSSYSPFPMVPEYTGNFMCPLEMRVVSEGLHPCSAVDAMAYLLVTMIFFACIYAALPIHVVLELIKGTQTGTHEGVTTFYLPAFAANVGLIYLGFLFAEYVDLKKRGKYARPLFEIFLVVLSALSYLLFWRA